MGLSVALLLLSGAAPCQTTPTAQDSPVSAERGQRVLALKPLPREPGGFFYNGQLLVQPRNALTTSGWSWYEQTLLCKELDAGDRGAWITLQSEVQRAAPWAQRVMAMYLIGKHRSPLVPVDPLRSLELYRLAAAQGDLSAQYELGLRFASGAGFGVDFAQARYWLEKAAAQGEADAKVQIGEMTRDGQGGEPDFDAALRIFRAGVDNDNMYAVVNLAAAYANGEGVGRDLVMAYTLLTAAGDRADTGFKRTLTAYKAIVARQLKPQQIKQAGRNAIAWIAAHPVNVYMTPPQWFGPEFDPATPCKGPAHPDVAKARRDKAKMVMQVSVDTQGSVVSVGLTKSSGFAALDEAIITTVKACHFTPALRFGQPVQGEKQVTHTW